MRGAAAAGLIVSIVCASFAEEPPDRVKAKALEARMEALSGRWDTEQERFLRECLAVIPGVAGLADFAPSYPKPARIKREVARAARENAEAEAKLVLEMTIQARRLSRYKETGVLPPEPSGAEVRELKAFLDDPWSKARPVPELSRDILALEEQLRHYERLLHPAAGTFARRGSKERLRAAVAAAPREPPRIEARLEYDSFRARAAVDPLPELIASLSSPDPRERALAADELGRLGRGAAKAVPALRKSLEDADARVRASTVTALSLAAESAPWLAGDLKRALEDKNEDVRLSAREALGRISPP